MTNPTPHGQVPEALIDLIDAYAETRHRYGRIYNARTEAARKAVIEALSGVQALSAAPNGWESVIDEARSGLQDSEPSAFDNSGYRAFAETVLDAVQEGLSALAATPTPPAEQQATKETSGGFHVWRDISTAPKDGSRFVATGHNYGLYSEVRHTCVAQWFRGCWMEASDWNETSELKYLTHWMPLPSPPDDVAAPAEQQAAPKAAPTLPEGWTDCTIEFGNDGPEVVAYGPKRMMTRLAKWLGKYFAQVIAEAAPKAAPGVGNSGFDHQTAADFLSGKTVSDEAAPQQVGDVPESLVLAVDQWFADNIKDSGGCTSQDVHELAELFYDVTHEGGRESVDDALAIVESFGPGIGGLNDAYARQVLLAEEVKRLREQAPNPERTGELLMGLAVIRELTGTQQKGLEETIEAVRAAVNAQKHPPAPATMAVNDALRDRLVAISAAVADQDDRAAQAMLREILKTPQPAPAEQEEAAAKQEE